MKFYTPFFAVLVVMGFAVQASQAATGGAGGASAAATSTAAPAAAAAAAPSAAGNPIANQPNLSMGVGVGAAPAPAITNMPPPQQGIPGASVPMSTANPAAATFNNNLPGVNRIGVAPGSPSSIRGTAGMNGFGPMNARSVIAPTSPGRAANIPGPAGAVNSNSAFQPAASPFAQNPQAVNATGVPANMNRGLAGIPASAFTTSVAAPTPPGPTSVPTTAPFYPLYLPNGQMNPYVGPNRPLANGQVNTQLSAAQATLMAQQTATQNGMVFQNGQWWYQAPGGYWEYYRGNRWNAYPAAAAERTTSTTSPVPVSAPISSAGAPATPVYSYDVPAYSP